MLAIVSGGNARGWAGQLAMGLFDNLGSSSPTKRIIEPVRLFRALPNREDRFVAPRDIQAEVWDAWFKRRTEHDLILKMNTGSGKTVVGLLILLSSLNEGVGPAVYLVPDRHLQRQVVRTAEALGVPATTEFDDPGFRRAESILIVTVAKLINGRSRFGIRGAPGVRPLQLGALVVDDAHSSIPFVEDQFSMTIPAGETYRAIRDLFADDIKDQSLSGWNEIRAGAGSAVVPIPYWSWQAKLDRAAALLAGQASDDENQFRWPLLKDHLELCDVAITPTELEIALPTPYLDAVPSFTGAQRRIYMTATLADDSVVVSRLGADPATALTPVTPADASDLGDRMILTPLQTSRSVSISDLQLSMVAFARSYNVVVIVPSRFRAKSWEPYTTEIHRADTISACVDRLESGHVGLVVFVAKYDGVDLPGNACRILVIDGLPERYSPLERVEAAALGDTDVIRTNQIQRIEQGMGRGVRSATDFSAVILLDPRLVQRLDLRADLDVLSPGTRAQIALSRELEPALKGQPMARFDDAIRDFLNRDPAWTGPAKSVLDALPYPPPAPLPAYVLAEREAFEFATMGRFLQAGERLLAGIDEVDDAWLRGWLKQRAASYLQHVDANRARDIQRSALIDNNFILHPALDVTVPRLTLAGQQAALATAYLDHTFSDARSLEIHVEAVLADLTPAPVPGTHKAFEKAVQELGQLLGFGSARPDNDYRVGPDNLWATGNDHYMVIECKSEAVSTRISRSELEQLSHSVDWFDSEYSEPRYTATPVLIHPSRTPFADAIPRQGARVLTFEKLAELRDAARDWTQALTVDAAFKDESKVKAALAQFGFLGSQFESRWTQPPLPST
ncbi:DEAD/DEAH box helicase [Leifsonia sp. LS1]|uniref:DEAD/DEAH box helicase n=1 Tax=Leifsonia sp. LS1 TaxID=2828483 RepID=UPI001CFDAD28|nr:DEAD/DEAH box helicase [Leifsonia sp. LS1]GIT78485.1 DEAD/DEAH box helicase [Leifsonia sp. LS1]